MSLSILVSGNRLDSQITVWLREWRDGDDLAIERVTADVYAELRRLAAHYLRGEQSAHTLQPTALVHEAYLQIEAVRDFDWRARGQFIAVLAQMMRRILVDHARRRNADKRQVPHPSDVPVVDLGAPSLDVILVDELLSRMSQEHPRHAQAVELRFFGGLSSPEIANALEISLATVERDWRFAKAWLQAELTSRA